MRGGVPGANNTCNQLRQHSESKDDDFINPNLRSFTGGLFEKITDQANKHGESDGTLTPYHKFENTPTIFVRVYFAHTCKGMNFRSYNHQCKNIYFTTVRVPLNPRQT